MTRRRAGLRRDTRNVFDPYDQPENRVTHALMIALHEDEKLLKVFLKELAREAPPGGRGALEISAQRYPEGREIDGPDEAEAGRRRIPDAWITRAAPPTTWK